MLVTNLFPRNAFFADPTPEETAAAKATADAAAAKAESDAAAAKAEADAKAAKDKADKDKTPISPEYADRLRNEAAAARQEAATAKEAAKAAQATLDKIEADKLKANGEYEKLAQDAQKKADAAEKKLQDAQALADKRYIDAEIKLAAVTAGMNDSADALTFVNRDGIKLEGETVTGAKEAVDALKATKAYLFKPAGEEIKRDAKGQIIPATPNNKNKGEPVNAKDMKPDEFKNIWDNLGKKAA